MKNDQTKPDTKDQRRLLKKKIKKYRDAIFSNFYWRTRNEPVRYQLMLDMIQIYSETPNEEKFNVLVEIITILCQPAQPRKKTKRLSDPERAAKKLSEILVKSALELYDTLRNSNAPVPKNK